MTVTVGYTVVKATFTGRSGTGSVSVPGLVAGDKLFWLSSESGGNDPSDGPFEYEISSDDSIQQITVQDLSLNNFTALFIRN